MTVFRGFIKLALRQLHMLLLYVAVFVTIAVIVQLSLREEGTDTFEMTSLPVAVEDRDGGAAAEGLKEYLGQIHRVTEWEGDLTGLQEKMFYRVQKGVKKAAPGGSVSACGGGCGFP